MLFRQIVDSGSATYTYLLAARRGTEALIIDPVLEKVDQYLRLIDELDLKLVKAIDTHMHADHVSGKHRNARPKRSVRLDRGHVHFVVAARARVGLSAKKDPQYHSKHDAGHRHWD